tara:strand:+ start:945 stop:1115 length:171 start_codon:yes stop_codon:yes gene_type:complete
MLKIGVEKKNCPLLKVISLAWMNCPELAPIVDKSTVTVVVGARTVLATEIVGVVKV